MAMRIARPAPGERPVVLSGRDSPPMVMGSPVAPLTEAQYDAVSALVEAGDLGLTSSELMDITGRKAPVQTLRELKGSSPIWDVVIHGARRSGGRYKVAWPRDEEIDTEFLISMFDNEIEVCTFDLKELSREVERIGASMAKIAAKLERANELRASVLSGGFGRGEEIDPSK
jgi:hypothetical protein